MSNPEINAAWEAKLEQDNEAQARKAAQLALRHELVARKDAALAVAQGIIDRGGHHVVPQSDIAAVYDEQVSDYIPMGALSTPDFSGRSHCFARVEISRDTALEPVEVQGRFFTRTKLERTVTDKVNGFGVTMFAGTEDGTHLQYFDRSHWSITQGYEDPAAIEKVEAHLAIVADALADQPQPE